MATLLPPAPAAAAGTDAAPEPDELDPASTALLHRFTVEDYHRMAEAGILGPDTRVELLDGLVYDMAPIGTSHGGSGDRLTELFVRLAGDPPRWIVRVGGSIRLTNRSEPLPDLALLRRRAAEDDFYDDVMPGPADVLLLVEVSESSLRHDRRTKARLYARAGIVEYWIVNLVERRVEIHRDPDLAAGNYRLVRTAAPEENLSLAAAPEVTVPVRRLLRGGG